LQQPPFNLKIMKECSKCLYPFACKKSGCVYVRVEKGMKIIRMEREGVQQVLNFEIDK
jgi:hypothetical protein